MAWDHEVAGSIPVAPTNPPSITCPVCRRTSYNDNDIWHKYCGYCHQHQCFMICQRCRDSAESHEQVDDKFPCIMRHCKCEDFK